MMKSSIIFFAIPLALAFACGNGDGDGAGFHAAASAALSQAAPADHFKALGPDKSTDNPDDSLFWPSDYEAAAASHPDPAGLVLFSLCRRAPFTSATLYGPFSAANADAIVNDTLFTLVDGTT